MSCDVLFLQKTFQVNLSELIDFFFSFSTRPGSQEAHAFISASNKDECTEEQIAAVLTKVRAPMERYRRNSRPTEREEIVVKDHAR